MSIVEADDCFVYDKHQWLNQGCVGVSDQDGTLGQPLNQKGKIIAIYILQQLYCHSLIKKFF